MSYTFKLIPISLSDLFPGQRICYIMIEVSPTGEGRRLFSTFSQKELVAVPERIKIGHATVPNKKNGRELLEEDIRSQLQTGNYRKLSILCAFIDDENKTIEKSLHAIHIGNKIDCGGGTEWFLFDPILDYLKYYSSNCNVDLNSELMSRSVNITNIRNLDLIFKENIKNYKSNPEIEIIKNIFRNKRDPVLNISIKDSINLFADNLHLYKDTLWENSIDLSPVGLDQNVKCFTIKVNDLCKGKFFHKSVIFALYNTLLDHKTSSQKIYESIPKIHRTNVRKKGATIEGVVKDPFYGEKVLPVEHYNGMKRIWEISNDEYLDLNNGKTIEVGQEFYKKCKTKKAKEFVIKKCIYKNVLEIDGERALWIWFLNNNNDLHTEVIKPEDINKYTENIDEDDE